VRITGMIMVACSLAMIWEPLRDFAFGIVALVYGLIWLADVIAILASQIHVSAFFFGFITLTWLYAEAAVSASALRAQHLDLTEHEQAVIDGYE
jgi:hypothetical protein